MSAFPRCLDTERRMNLAKGRLRTQGHHDHDSLVYLVGGPKDRSFGLVKIGQARNVEKRLRTLQIGSPVLLQVYRTYLGGEDLEMWLHRAFKKERAHGEWFRLMGEWERIEAQVRKWRSAAMDGQGAFPCDRRPCPAHPTRWCYR